MTDRCPTCRQPMPAHQAGVHISTLARVVIFPDGSMLRLRNADIAFLHDLCARTPKTIPEAMKLAYGSKNYRRYSYGAFAVRLSMLRAKLRKFGYTITPLPYRLAQVKNAAEARKP